MPMGECALYGGTPIKRANISGDQCPSSADKRPKLYGVKEGGTLCIKGGRHGVPRERADSEDPAEIGHRP